MFREKSTPSFFCNNKLSDLDLLIVRVVFRQALGLEGEELAQREVDVIDIAYDDVPEHQYKEEEVKN